MEPFDDPIPTTPALMYLSAAPTSNGNISGQELQTAPGQQTLYQLQVNPANPNQAALLPAPGADATLSAHPDDTIMSAYRMKGLPKPGQEFLEVEKPTLLEKVGENWKISEMGTVKFRDSPAPELNVFDRKADMAEQTALVSRAEQLAGEIATTTGNTRAEAEAELEGVANRAELGPDAGRAAYADELRDAGRAELNDDLPKPNQEAAFENGVVRDEQYAEWAAEAKANREAQQAEEAQYQQARIEVNRRMSEGDTRPEEDLFYEALGDIQQAAASQAVRAADSAQDEQQQSGVEQQQSAVGVTPGSEAAPITVDFPLMRETPPEGAGMTPQESYIRSLEQLGAVVKLNYDRPNETDAQVIYAHNHPNASELTALLEKRDQFRPTADDTQNITPVAVPLVALGTEQPAPGNKVAPAPEGAGELQFNWKQKGDEVAPLLEMRAYLDQLKDAGVAVGALKFERGEDGKLGGSFGVSYDPASNRISQLEGAIQGFKQVGNGLEIVEKPEQALARRAAVGNDVNYDPGQSKQVKEAFDVKQWDALSAQLSGVPKQALSAPEQAQQVAGNERIEQIATQKGKVSHEVLQDAKSLLDMDLSGNPASAFLKNFYAHLTGGGKTRQHVESDFDKTRQELQARLTKQAGNAQPLGQDARPELVAPSVKAMENTPKLPDLNTPGKAPADSQGAKPAPGQTPGAPKFTEADVPQRVLESLGITAAELKGNGQLQKLLNGEKTDLLKMQVAGKEGQEPVSFEGKMVLYREADGTATLKMDLPRKQLEIPNEIGGQPFTPEQRQRLETEGSAGLMRGLKDAQGKEFNGYVGVDKAMNKLVVLPEDRVKLTDTIAGVKLTPEQSHDLREGKAVELKNMSRVDGGKPFDGTAQIHAAKAGVEVKPAASELALKNAPKETQARDLNTSKPAQAPDKVKVRGPRL